MFIDFERVQDSDIWLSDFLGQSFYPAWVAGQNNFANTRWKIAWQWSCHLSCFCPVLSWDYATETVGSDLMERETRLELATSSLARTSDTVTSAQEWLPVRLPGGCAAKSGNEAAGFIVKSLSSFKPLAVLKLSWLRLSLSTKSPGWVVSPNLHHRLFYNSFSRCKHPEIGPIISVCGIPRNSTCLLDNIKTIVKVGNPAWRERWRRHEN